MPSEHPSAPPPSDRRIATRQFACFPAHVKGPDGGTRTAMIHDLSVTGGRLLVRADLHVGDRISLVLYVTGDASSPTPPAAAQVVRIEELVGNAVGPWTHKVAVQFDTPLSELREEIGALEERQRQLGLVK